MDWKEVIENLKYLISEDCTDTQFDYADEIEIAIRVMESQEDKYSKINKATSNIELMLEQEKQADGTYTDVGQGIAIALGLLNNEIGEL